MKKTILAVFASLLAAAPVAWGAETEQKFGFSPESFEIKYYIQPRFSVFSDTLDAFDAKVKGVDHSFAVRRSRIYVTSTVIPTVKGRIQFEVKPDKVEALDVYFEWSPKLEGKKPLSFTVGQYKKPMSYQEFVMGSNNLNLIDRTFSHAFLEKSVLASSRDQGVMATADLWEYDVPVLLNLGVFNGNGLGKKLDDNTGKEVVARAEVTPLTGISVGGNVVVNRLGIEDAAESYSVWGGDVVLARSGFQVVAEVFGGDNNAKIISSGDTSLDAPTFLAWYGEAIYRSIPGWEPAARVEVFDPDTDTEDDGRTVVTGQIAKSLSPNFRWQVNVVHTIPQDSALDSRTDVVSQWTVRL